ncbi:MAG: hypothetical protein CVV29_09845 [Methanobacteriales archaeon HGW-Methanobacteriales-2]|nr:MAG: hypothetical protein CVV29_09845 [Methanobacteriales archaeon HGW-Methanobacteriales-2]
MILDIFKDAVEYSAQDWKSVVELGGFLFFSFLIFPIFLVWGYFYNVTQTAVNGLINGNDPLPKFNHLGDMLIKGIKIFLVKLLYGLLFLILIYILYLSQLNFFITLTIVIIVGILLYLISSIAMVHMVEKKGDMKSVFKIREILSIINSIGWSKLIGFYLGFMALAFGIFIVVTFLFGVVMGILGVTIQAMSLTLVIGNTMALLILLLYGIFISFIFIPYFVIFEGRALGLIYNLGK